MTLSLEETARLRHGDPGMRRVRLGLFAAGLVTFAAALLAVALLSALSLARTPKSLG